MSNSAVSEKLKKELFLGMGQRLRQAREKAGFNVKMMSRLFDTTENVYRKIEAGKFALSCEMMVIVNRLLGVSIDWLFTGEEPMGKPIVYYHKTSLHDGMTGG